MGISVVFLLALMSLYTAYQKTFFIGSAYLDLHANVRLAMDWMERDVKSATQVVTSHSGYTTGNNVLVLEVPSIDSAGDVVDIENDFDYIVYRVSGTVLYRITYVAATSSREAGSRQIAENCSTLTFSSGGTDLGSVGDLGAINDVTISLTMSETVLGMTGQQMKTIEDTLESKVMFRNKRS